MGDEGDLVAERMARGCRCFGAWLGGEVVAYGWLSSRPEWIGEIGLEITPATGEAYVWNCVTLPRHRRRGVFRTLLIRIIALARAEGTARLWIGSVDKAGASAVARAGFVPVLDIDMVTLPWFRWLALKPAKGAEAALVSTALRALAAGEGPLRWRSSLRRARRRRH